MSTQRIKVWDPLVRVFHWSLALGFVTLYLTEDDYLGLHVAVGYFILALLLVRIVWGFAGSRHARFADFVKRPTEILAYFKDVIRSRARRYLGHNPAGGAMVIALMASVALTGVLGLLVYGTQEFSGPFAGLAFQVSDATAHRIEEAHEWVANFTLVLVGLHLLGVLLASLQHRENLVRSMFTGYKTAAEVSQQVAVKGDGDEKVKSHHGGIVDAGY
ncbi:MAG: cytochrome b/b6 domain-containing protein [Pseudomonadota bacterium]